jgi:hypothetical protein
MGYDAALRMVAAAGRAKRSGQTQQKGETNMCNPESRELIHEVVTQRVQGDEMFTAFEISLAVQESARERGLPVERHRDMRGTIHEEMTTLLSGGLYQRSLQNVGAPEPAYVYYPQGGDPTQYVPLSRRDGNQGKPKAGITPTPIHKPVNPNDKPVTASGPTALDGGSGVTSGGGGSGIAGGTNTPPQPIPGQSGGRYDVGVTGTGSPQPPQDASPADHGQPAGGGRKPDARNTLAVSNRQERQRAHHLRHAGRCRCRHRPRRHLRLRGRGERGLRPPAQLTAAGGVTTFF